MCTAVGAEGVQVVAGDATDTTSKTLTAVGAQSEQVVTGDALGLAGLGHHEQLGGGRDGRVKW